MKTYKFHVVVDIVYKDGQELRNNYNVNWTPETQPIFEQWMIGLMDAIAYGEEPGYLDKINIISMDIDNGLQLADDELTQVKSFINDTNIVLNLKK